MNHVERVRAALEGSATDRPPASMWRHYFGKEQSAEDLADAMLAHQRRFDWDYMKVNSRASYHSEPWGIEAKYSGNGAPEISAHPVTSERDWSHIGTAPMTNPIFREQLIALELIGRGLDRAVPFLTTVFSPVSVASRLMESEDEFMRHLRGGSNGLATALEAITDTFTAFAEAALDRGSSGLFFATTAFATTDRMSVAEYRKLVRPWDLRLLNALPTHEFTLLHVCRGNVMLAEFADYPVHAVNWDTFASGNPGLAQGKVLLRGKVVIGGLGRSGHILSASPAQMYGQVQGLASAMGPSGWMLGTACTYDPEAQVGNIDAVRLSVDSL